MYGRQTDARRKFAAVGASREQIDDARPHFPRRGVVQVPCHMRAMPKPESLRHEQINGLPHQLFP